MPHSTGRVLALLDLLQSAGTQTADHLADRLGVDPRTVRRYVEHLADLGIPVESVRGRYGGYRIGSGFRVPPLMFSDDEALAVLLGLIAARQTGTVTGAEEAASAKIRRVLPARLAQRLEALTSVAVTDTRVPTTAPDAVILLTVADAARHRRPLSMRYADRHDRITERILHAHGVVAHSGRWYVVGRDAERGEERTFRLDRIAEVRALPGAFAPPADPDMARRLERSFATADYKHAVTLRVQGTVEQIRAHLPATVAVLDHEDPGEVWRRVEIRAAHLDWLPPVLAHLNRPFVVERPDELRADILAFGERLASYARRSTITANDRAASP